MVKTTPAPSRLRRRAQNAAIPNLRHSPRHIFRYRALPSILSPIPEHRLDLAAHVPRKERQREHRVRDNIHIACFSPLVLASNACTRAVPLSDQEATRACGEHDSILNACCRAPGSCIRSALYLVETTHVSRVREVARACARGLGARVRYTDCWGCKLILAWPAESKEKSTLRESVWSCSSSVHNLSALDSHGDSALCRYRTNLVRFLTASLVPSSPRYNNHPTRSVEASFNAIHLLRRYRTLVAKLRAAAIRDRGAHLPDQHGSW
jgi:hypothetical protein